MNHFSIFQNDPMHGRLARSPTSDTDNQGINCCCHGAFKLVQYQWESMRTANNVAVADARYSKHNTSKRIRGMIVCVGRCANKASDAEGATKLQREILSHQILPVWQTGSSGTTKVGESIPSGRRCQAEGAHKTTMRNLVTSNFAPHDNQVPACMPKIFPLWAHVDN